MFHGTNESMVVSLMTYKRIEAIHQDPKTGRFVEGNRGGGRGKGARNLLGERMIADLYVDWCAHGIQALETVRENRPHEYLKVVAMLVSKCDESVFKDMGSIAEEIEEFIEERRRKAMLMIERMKGS